MATIAVEPIGVTVYALVLHQGVAIQTLDLVVRDMNTVHGVSAVVQRYTILLPMAGETPIERDGAISGDGSDMATLTGY